MMLDGAPLVAALERHVRLDNAAILEIGPGYGRLLRALLGGVSPKSKVQSPKPARPKTLDFGLGTWDIGSYVGLDISAYWTRQLTAEFGRLPNVELVQGAAEDADTLFAGRQFNVIVSLLTWKHLYPDFSAAARSCRNLLAADGRLIFDVPETGVAWRVQADEPSGKFEQETGTFTRTYSRDEVETLLPSAGLAVAAFDEIEHAIGKRRLLTVAAGGRG